MSAAYLSVAEAAKVLGVHPQRIHQRIRDGSLPAEKVGHQWAVEMNDLRRVEHHAGPGRPLSAKSAWDLLAVAAGDHDASRLSPSARSRARSRLRSLLAQASSAELDKAAALIKNALRNRAKRVLLAASPRDLPDLFDDARIHLSGVSLPASNMSVGSVAEGYVSSNDVDGLVEHYLLSPAGQSRANVILHVVPPWADHPAMDDVAHSPLALAADLAEHDGAREKNEAIRALADLRSHLGGADRG